MAIYYARETALEFWRWKATTLSNLHEPAPIAQPKLFRKPTNALEAITGCEHFHDPTTPLCVMVQSMDYVRSHPDVRFMVCSQPLPARSLFKINAGMYVVSPELLFLQLAIELPFPALVALGCELTGRYAKNSDDPRGFCACEPLTTTKAINSLLSHASGFKGVKNARIAAKALVGNAASPMEAYATLLLTLPNSLGGYGLPKPVLNHRLDLTAEQTFALKRNSITVDMGWPRQKVAIEYESNAWHSGNEKFVLDSKRRNDIRSLGFDVTTITLDEYKSPSSMDRIASAIAKRLSVRLRLSRIDRNKQAELRRAFWKC